MKKTIFFSFTLFLLSISNSFGQNTYEFLKLDMSARAASLAGSYVTNGDDPNVIFYNPAGLEMLEGTPVSFSFVKHVLDINLASLAYSTELKNIGRVGAAIEYVNYGTFTQADESGNKMGTYGAGEVAAVFGYSNLLDQNFYYGTNVKLIYSKIADRSSSAIAVDLGLHYSLKSQLIDFGFAIMNLGTQMSAYYSTKEALPLDIVFGVSKKMEHLPLRLSLDFHNLNDKNSNFSSKLKAFTFGAEFVLSQVLRLRFGYDNQRRNDLTIGSFAGIAGFNVGLGLVISKYNFDYGFSSLGLMGAIHRISISTAL
ncbi:MAG: type IX secretion system protein PorQ [Ignavibacteriaceae bacterium]